MTYITIPNSLTTATTVLADPVDANFRALENGLKDGTKTLRVYQLTTESGTVTGDLTASGTFNVQGTDIGGKAYFPIALVTSGSFKAAGDGYIGNSRGGTVIYSAISQPVIMHSSGSVRAFSVHYHNQVSTLTGTQSFQLHVDGASVASCLVTRSLATSWKQVVTLSRNVASFNSGGKISAYYVENQSSSVWGDEALRIFAEVQFDG